MGDDAIAETAMGSDGADEAQNARTMADEDRCSQQSYAKAYAKASASGFNPESAAAAATQEQAQAQQEQKQVEQEQQQTQQEQQEQQQAQQEEQQAEQAQQQAHQGAAQVAQVAKRTGSLDAQHAPDPQLVPELASELVPELAFELAPELVPHLASELDSQLAPQRTRPHVHTLSTVERLSALEACNRR